MRPRSTSAAADLTIAELANKVRTVVGFEGRLRFNPERPDGTPQKLLNTSRLSALGWQPRIPLDQGLATTYRWYLDQVASSASASDGTRERTDAMRPSSSGSTAKLTPNEGRPLTVRRFQARLD